MADNQVPGDGIVSVTERLRHLRFPEQAKLATYWQKLRGTRLVPSRADVDPRAIEDCLEYAFILERIAPGLARFRLAGMHLNDLMGMEVRGMPVTCFFPPDSRRRISAVLEEVCETPSTALIELRGEEGFGKPGIQGELSLMPMMNDFGDVSRILGALTTVGSVGRTPRRFEVTNVRVTAIPHPEGRFRDNGPRLPRTDEILPKSNARRRRPEAPARPESTARPETATRPDASQAPGFSDPKRTFDHTPARTKVNAAKPKRPHLYLVKSDD